MWGKKADTTLVGMLFIVILIFLFLIWTLSFTQKECRTNSDCASNSYCGSDFACHRYPEVQSAGADAGSFTLPALLIGISLIVAAYILRARKLPIVQFKGQDDPGQEKSSQSFEHYGDDPHKKDRHH